ncbi:MAG TPA: hypothetical protein VL463_14250 [Kofleriaceae bacterium]|nr:hypothetical protein [Kofleriaceae bacterium]
MRPLACLLASAAVLAVATPADAKPKKKYHFALDEVRAGKDVTADLATEVVPRLEAQAEKLLGGNPQIVVNISDAPDPEKDAPGFTKYLAKKKIEGAYKVTIEITAATEELEPVEAKPNTQRISVHLEVHMFGEAMPTRKMGFYGDGSSTIKMEIGKKLRPKDRDAAWDDAASEALTKAIDESLTKLSLPPPKPTRK